MIYIRSFILVLLSSALLYSCQSKEVKNEDTCPNFFKYGTTTICLPLIDSMNNYYPDTTIKRMADRLEAETNSVQAFYITDEAFNGAKETGLMFNDNFLKIFTIDGLVDVKADSAYLEQVSNSIISSNPFHDITEIRTKLETGMDFITAWQPLYLEKYTPAPGVRSFVMMLKYGSGSKDELLMSILNIMLMHDKLIGSNYYKQYKGAETLEQARTKNDAIVRRMMEMNKTKSEK